MRPQEPVGAQHPDAAGSLGGVCCWLEIAEWRGADGVFAFRSMGRTEAPGGS